MLQRFLAQDDERTPNTKPRRASNDADDGLASIMVRCCRAGLKTGTLASLSGNNPKSYIVLHCSTGGLRPTSDIKCVVLKAIGADEESGST